MRLTRPQYIVLARIRNNMGIGEPVNMLTIESLRRRGLIGQHDCEITRKGNAVMDSYSEKSKSP